VLIDVTGLVEGRLLPYRPVFSRKSNKGCDASGKDGGDSSARKEKMEEERALGERSRMRTPALNKIL